jgi:hypothetical protein
MNIHIDTLKELTIGQIKNLTENLKKEVGVGRSTNP